MQIHVGQGEKGSKEGRALSQSGPKEGVSRLGLCCVPPSLNLMENRKIKLLLVKILVSPRLSPSASPTPEVSPAPFQSPCGGGDTPPLPPQPDQATSALREPPAGPLTYEEDDAKGVCQDHVSKSPRSCTCAKKRELKKKERKKKGNGKKKK